MEKCNWNNLKDKKCKRIIKVSLSCWGILYKDNNTVIWLSGILATSSNKPKLLRLDWFRISSWSKVLVSRMKTWLSHSREQNNVLSQEQGMCPCLVRRMFFQHVYLPGGNEFQKSVISSKEAKWQRLSPWGELISKPSFLFFQALFIVFLRTSFQAIEVLLDPSQPSIRFEEVMISPLILSLSSTFWTKEFSQVFAQYLDSLAFDTLWSLTLAWNEFGCRGSQNGYLH